MNILVIGGSSFIGLQIVKILSNKNHDVFIYNRGNNNNALPKKVQPIIGDRSNSSKLKEVFSLRIFDVVVDMCAYNINDLKPLLEALPYKVPHLVFCSTAAVYDFPHNCYLKNGEENDLKAYGYNKLLCERYFQKNLDTKLSIIRPTYVYGPNDPSFRIGQIIEQLSHFQSIRISRSLNRYNTQMIFVDDLARAFCAVIENSDSQSGQYDLAYPETVNFISLIEKIGLLFQKEIKLNFTDKESGFPFDLYSDQLIDAWAAWKKLGIQPEFNLEKGLEKTVDWWKENAQTGN